MNQGGNRAQSMRKPDSKQNSKTRISLLQQQQTNSQAQQQFAQYQPINVQPHGGQGQPIGIQNVKMVSGRRGESQHPPTGAGMLHQNASSPQNALPHHHQQHISHSQNNKGAKVGYGFFYQQQPQQQVQGQMTQGGGNGGASQLITQVNKNQAMHADLTNQEKAAFQNQQQTQQYQKFGKEPLPPHLAACGPQRPWAQGKKTLVLDLDETLVHSSFKPPPKPDIILPVEIEGNICNVFVLIRPGTEFFLQRLAKCYELVIYTASLSKYADPLIDILDSKPQKVIDYRLFREHCTFFQGVFIKDMTLPGRPMTDSIIIDNSPTSYAFHQENALPILSWYDDPKDRCLFELIPLLESLAEVDDVRKYIPKFVTADHKVDFQKASYILSNAVTKSQLKKQQSPSEKQNAKAAHARNKRNDNLGGVGEDDVTTTRLQIMPVDVSDVEKLEDEDTDAPQPIAEEVKQPSGRRSITQAQQRRRSSKMRVNSVGQSQNVNQIADLMNASDQRKKSSEDDQRIVNAKPKNNAWTAEEGTTQESKPANEDQSHRNFSKQRHDSVIAQPMKSTNTQSNLSKDINLQQIKIDGQQQQQRPVTRENQRMPFQNANDEGAQMNSSAQQIKSAITGHSQNKHRKLNNQYFSRQSQLQQLLQTDQQQYKKSFNAPSNNQFNAAMTDGSIKLLQPSSKTPNNKHAHNVNLQRGMLSDLNTGLTQQTSQSLQRQPQTNGLVIGMSTGPNIVNVQGMFSTPKHGLLQNQQLQSQAQQMQQHSQPSSTTNQGNSMFKFFPPQGSGGQTSASYQGSNSNSQANSEVTTFRGPQAQQQRDYSNKNLVRTTLQMQLNELKNNGGLSTSINKQRRMRRNNEGQLNVTQPVIQNVSSSDMDINDITPKHLKTPSRVQQNRYTGSLINKRRQNSRQKLVLGNGSMGGNGLNSSYQRLAGANIHLDNSSNFIQNSNIVINNIQAPVAFGANNQLILGGANRPISGKRQNGLILNNFSTPKSNSQNTTANTHQILNAQKQYGGSLGMTDLSPYTTPLNKNLIGSGAGLSAALGQAVNGSNLGGVNIVNSVGPNQQEYAQKRLLRNLNRKANGFSHS